MNKTMNKTRIILISLCLLSLLLFLTCCGEKIVVHEHEFEDEISYDDNYHFYKATCGHDVTSTKEAHLFGEERIIRAATSTQNGLKEKECSVCGYKVQEDVIYLGKQFSSSWDYDSEYHYHKDLYSEAKTDNAPHDFSDWITLSVATVYQEGLKYRECSVCGYKQEEVENMLNVKKIPRLQKGDTIALIAPASPGSSSSASNTKSALEAKGFKVKVYPSVTQGSSYSVSYLALSDEVRAKEINDCFKDPTIKGIVCLRGGYGSSRTLDLLDYDAIRENPKFFTGYSDITALINSFYYKSGIISYQGFMGSNITSSDTITANDIDDVLFNSQEGKEFKYGKYISKSNDAVQGTLIGGNLSLFVHLLGSEYLPNCKDKIIFLEDTGESTYALDRMITKLRLFHVFDECKGVVLGYFTNASEKTEIQNMLKREFGNMNIPVLNGFPSGHESPFVSLPIGALVELSPNGLKILEDVFE